jgi:hypothetical protein
MIDHLEMNSAPLYLEMKSGLRNPEAAEDAEKTSFGKITCVILVNDPALFSAKP